MWMAKSEQQEYGPDALGSSQIVPHFCLSTWPSRFMYDFGVCWPAFPLRPDTMKKASWFFWAFVGLVWLVVSLPFSDYSLSSLFDVPRDPPSSREGLHKLLENIVFWGNVCVLSMFMLYGMTRRWYLRDDYPRWLRRMDLQARFTKLFQSQVVLSSTMCLLIVLAAVSSVLLILQSRVLGRGLGY